MARNAAVVESAELHYLADDEIVRRINAIDAATAVRLERIAAIYSYGSEWSPGDLMQEAIVAALERRQWRSDLSTVVFLTGVMRSLAHARRKHEKSAPLDRGTSGSEENALSPDEIPGGEGTDPAEIVEAEDALIHLVGRLTRCFEGDAQVQRVIRGRAAGEDPAAIRNDLGMNPSEYETVCRRMLRAYQTRLKVQES